MLIQHFAYVIDFFEIVHMYTQCGKNLISVWVSVTFPLKIPEIFVEVRGIFLNCFSLVISKYVLIDFVIILFIIY